MPCARIAGDARGRAAPRGLPLSCCVFRGLGVGAVAALLHDPAPSTGRVIRFDLAAPGQGQRAGQFQVEHGISIQDVDLHQGRHCWAKFFQERQGRTCSRGQGNLGWSGAGKQQSR